MSAAKTPASASWAFLCKRHSPERVEYQCVIKNQRRTILDAFALTMTMTLTWIAKRLNMRTAGSLANLLRDAEENNNMRLWSDLFPFLVFAKSPKLWRLPQ